MPSFLSALKLLQPYTTPKMHEVRKEVVDVVVVQALFH
jgi:hypothetical protein